MHPSINESRDFPQICFNKYRQQHQELQRKSIMVRSNLTMTQSSHKISQQINPAMMRSTSEAQNIRRYPEAHKNPFHQTSDISSIMDKKKLNTDYHEVIKTPMSNKIRDPSFINCDNQLRLVGSSEKNEFPLMTSLLCQNKELLQESLQQSNREYHYEVVNPEVRRIIEEFKREQENEKNASHMNSFNADPQTLISHTQFNTPNQQQQHDSMVSSISRQMNTNFMNRVQDTPSQQCAQSNQSPPIRDRQGLYQFMRDCQKIQKCRSDQSVKMTDMSLRLSQDDDTSTLKEESIRIYDQISEQNQIPQGTKNSINLSVKQYSTKLPIKESPARQQFSNQSHTKSVRSQWDKENKSQQNIKPQIGKNFYQRLERDVTRRQSKVKQPTEDKPNKKQPLNKVLVFEAIDKLRRRSYDHKKDPSLVKNLKHTVTWLFKQIQQNTAKQSDDDFLHELEQLDQFKIFLDDN